MTSEGKPTPAWENVSPRLRTKEETPAHPGEALEASIPARLRRVAARGRINPWIVGVLLWCFVYFPGPSGDWYQEARMDTTLALVTHHTPAIDAYQMNTGDKDSYRGHYFSITAPGQSLAGVPAAAAFEALAGPDGLSSAAHGLTFQFFVLKYLETLLTATMPAVLLLMLFFWFLGFFSTSVAHRVLLTLALGLATNLYPYSQVLYAHAAASALAFAGMTCLYLLRRPPPHGGRLTVFFRRNPLACCVAAGLALGSAVLFEYQTVVIFALGVVYAWTQSRPRAVGALLLGAAPPVLAALTMNALEYGNPFTTGYSGHSVSFHHAYSHGPAGFSWPPSLDALWGMSFSPYHGLFFLSPFLLAAVPGYLMWRRQPFIEWWPFLATPIAYWVAMSMYPTWTAGFSIGPRLLIPMVPFLAVPIVFVLDHGTPGKRRWLLFILLGLSFLNVWVQTVGGTGYPNARYADPLFDYSLPALLHGDLRASLGTIVLAPLVGSRSLLTLVPLLGLLVSWTAFCFRPRRGEDRRGA